MWPCARLLFVSPTGRNCVARNDAEICSSPCPRFLHFVHRPCEERFLCGIDDHICSYGSILRSDYSHDHALVTIGYSCSPPILIHARATPPEQGLRVQPHFLQGLPAGVGCMGKRLRALSKCRCVGLRYLGATPSPRRRYVQGQIEQGRVPQCPRHAECK